LQFHILAAEFPGLAKQVLGDPQVIYGVAFCCFDGHQL
jgi:hypothetical protein